MQALAPQIKELQAKHKDDKQALGIAQMELYRKHGINPMGSCWLAFLQMPIFLGLFYFLGQLHAFAGRTHQGLIALTGDPAGFWREPVDMAEFRLHVGQSCGETVCSEFSA